MTIPVEAGISPIAELFRNDCTAFWATTYNFQLSFFNEYLLRRLGDAPLNAVVLADQRHLDELLATIPAGRRHTVGAANRRWLLRGMQVGVGRFHPKTYLAVRPRQATLMVGSGNLSTNGIDGGREVFTAFTSGTPVGEAAIATWRAWIRRLVSASGDTLLAERFADLERRLPASSGPIEVVDSPVWHNLDEPLGPRFTSTVSEMAGRDIDELIATAPFFDEEGEALARLIEALRPAVLRLYTTTTTSVSGTALRNRLRDLDCDIELLAYSPDRFTHAKLIGATAAERGWLLSGSANLSRAALTLPPGPANIEVAVFAKLAATDVRQAFMPPDVEVTHLALDDLDRLSYDGSDDTTTAPALVRLRRAALLPDGRIEVLTDATVEAGWVLADHNLDSPLNLEGGNHVTAMPLEGPLVRLEGDDGVPVSNWAIIEDPAALAHALASTETRISGRPDELTGADLDTPLGRALLHLHRNLVMDASEIPTTTSSGTGVDDEDTVENGDDDLWDRLERETLARDPRAGTYERLLRRQGTADVLTNPIAELLDAMRGRVPADAPTSVAAETSVLRRLVQQHEERSERSKVTWSVSARVRVRTRNVLRRWATAQTDPRLAWVNPLAPVLNLKAVATTFAGLYLDAVDEDVPTELHTDDLDDLWARWFIPIVGTGHHDGWLDRHEVRELDELAADGFVEVCSALCWLAIRPGSSRRERRIKWQGPLAAALRHGLLDDTADSADYLSIIAGQDVAADQLTVDFLEAIDFLDDRLWCDQTAAELGLDSLTLEHTQQGTAGRTKAVVNGVTDPLHDPRLPRLVAAVQSYCRTDAVAVYGTDLDWRIVIEPDEPAFFLANLAADAQESTALTHDVLDGLAAGQRVLADLFPRPADVA